MRTGCITVTAEDEGSSMVEETGLYYGTYYVYELTEQDGTPIFGGNNVRKVINDTIYNVSVSGTSTTIGENINGTSELINNHETTNITGTKSWSDDGEHPTIYFKVFYELNDGQDENGYPNIGDIEVEGAEIKELPNGTTTVQWTDLPKYDVNGVEYSYRVKEYIKVGEEYIAAAPDGYVKTELGLTVNNIKSEGYEPKTTYSGTKIWVDTANDGATRPESMHVALYANDVLIENAVPQWTKGIGDHSNEWTYTFSDLPVFDENGVYIQYTVVETPVNGYDMQDQIVTPTSYQRMESQDPARVTTNSSLDITLAEETDLAYIVIKKNAHSHLIWTQRVISLEEKQKIYDDINQLEGFIGELSDSTVEFVSGLPIETVFEKGSVIVTKISNKTMHVTFIRENQWAQLCYGSYKYNYDPGTTTFTNKLHTVDVEAIKAWQDASSTVLNPVEGTTATFELFIGDDAQNKQITLNGKADIASEAEFSEEESIRAKQEVNAEAVAANAYEKEPWKAYWGDLAEYDKDGKKINYVVKEVDASEGFENLNPDGVSTGGTITNRQTEIQIGILKVDQTDGTTPLTGAKFKLRRYPDTSYQGYNKEWEEQEVSSDPDTKGTLTFLNVTTGYYELIEIQSPEGYIKTGMDPRFTVTADERGNLQVIFTSTDLVTYENGVFKVKNKPGPALPSTGGPGTKLFYLLGCFLSIGAAMILLLRKRRRI